MSRRIRAWPWLLCFQFFVAEQVARVHVQGPYSMARNSISDLGALHGFGVGAIGCSPLHLLMDASFTLQGLLILAGAVLAKNLFPDSMCTQIACIAFALSGLGVFVVGLAPEDVASRLHVLAASVHFLCGSLGMLLFGGTLLKMSRRAGVLSLASGVLALAATLLLGLRHSAMWTQLDLMTGVVERIAAYPLPLWLTVTGFILAARAGAREGTRGPGASAKL